MDATTQIFRKILKALPKTINPSFKSSLKTQIRNTRLDSINYNKKDLTNLSTFLNSSKKHSELSELYWPSQELTREEKLKRTANKVGFTLDFKKLPHDLTEKELELNASKRLEDELKDKEIISNLKK
ncbi:hypothetical protein HDU92_008420 [Lobulomyces angularis]|nr:hypothetical protein HDU92_008420 [Lobulomyces angularis]